MPALTTITKPSNGTTNADDGVRLDATDDESLILVPDLLSAMHPLDYNLFPATLRCGMADASYSLYSPGLSLAQGATLAKCRKLDAELSLDEPPSPDTWQVSLLVR